jgi:hypothetical protein
VQFFTYAIVATLVLWFLLELFNTVSVLQKIQLLSDLRTDNVVLEQASLDRAKYGDGAVLLPGLFMAAFARFFVLSFFSFSRSISHDRARPITPRRARRTQASKVLCALARKAMLICAGRPLAAWR